MTTSCACQGCASASPDPTNLPGQRSLRWRTSPHSLAMARMRARLADDSQDLDIRSLASQGGDEPAVALLDTWATVADIVTFYTERIAQEGFLRTATERESVRQHARSLGYELRPGVAAQVELVFDVETAPGAPAAVVVPAGTPVQTIPAPEQLPQTFETATELEARGVWNTIAAADRVAQPLGYGVDTLWLDTTRSGVKVDDHVLVVGSERRDVPAGAAHGDDHEKWDFRRIVAVEVDPPHAAGWTRLTLHRRIGYKRDRELVAAQDLHVYRPRSDSTCSAGTPPTAPSSTPASRRGRTTPCRQARREPRDRRRRRNRGAGRVAGARAARAHRGVPGLEREARRRHQVRTVREAHACPGRHRRAPR